jgi:hypothetical protein
VSVQDDSMREIYASQALEIFEKHLDSQYPEKNYKIIKLKTFTDVTFSMDGFEFVVKPSTLVEGKVRIGLFRTAKIYCFVDDNSRTIYTDYYFEDVLNGVQTKLNSHWAGNISYVDATTTLRGVAHDAFRGPTNLLPSTIKTAEDLFSYNNPNIYSLGIHIELQEGALHDFDYEYLFSVIQNRWNNEIVCQVNAADEHVDITLYNNSKTYYVDFKEQNKIETIGNMEIRYNDHFFAITACRTMRSLNYDTLLDEEKEYLQGQWRAGRVKAWYGYDIVVTPKYDAEIYKKCQTTKELKNGENIICNYTDQMKIIYAFNNDAIGRYRISNTIGQYCGGSSTYYEIRASDFLKNGLECTLHLDVFVKEPTATSSSYHNIAEDCAKYYGR